jgi:hypothetical protein
VISDRQLRDRIARVASNTGLAILNMDMVERAIRTSGDYTVTDIALQDRLRLLRDKQPGAFSTTADAFLAYATARGIKLDGLRPETKLSLFRQWQQENVASITPAKGENAVEPELRARYGDSWQAKASSQELHRLELSGAVVPKSTVSPERRSMLLMERGTFQRRVSKLAFGVRSESEIIERAAGRARLAAIDAELRGVKAA